MGSKLQSEKFKPLYMGNENKLSSQDKDVISEHLNELYHKEKYVNLLSVPKWIFYIVDGYCKMTIQDLEHTLNFLKGNQTHVLLINKDKLNDTLLPYLSMPVNGMTSLPYIKRNPKIVMQTILDKGLFLDPDFHRVVALEMDRINGKKPIIRLILKKEKVTWLLSEKEQNILQLILDGLNNGKIAKELHFAPSTVNTAIFKILKKIEANDRTEALVKAIRNRWVIVQR
ncbi:response regulator transcription factor [Salipaludibacillus sp. CF4.18]|uniref:response regulator transcription factor n=1 Tax=Salipaludibacillus sp. CF4.18 TaxID=3373081 RepID=UPI003EE74680